MLLIQSDSASEAWAEAVSRILAYPDTGNTKYMRDVPAVIEVMKPSLEDIDQRFPMKQEDIDVINRFIVSGEDEAGVVHEWTKLYHHRLFDEPFSQARFILERLNEEVPSASCHASIWEKEIDQRSEIQPCVQVVWARVRQGSLDLHVHAHSSDVFGKLLMNLLEFISLHLHFSKQSGYPIGVFRYFVDSCHLYAKDHQRIVEKGFVS